MRKCMVLVRSVSLLCATATAAAVDDIWHVDASATGTGTGISWANAFTDLQDAIGQADNDDQIWVAAGTYLPDDAGDRDATFALETGVEIYGGFAGGEGDLEDRDPLDNETILSGDLDDDDGPGAFEDNDENSYHVVSADTQDGLLDGFTITGGHADHASAFDEQQGAGMFVLTSSPTILRCTFHQNSAGDSGGGLYVRNSPGNPDVYNCSFIDNRAGDRGGGVLTVFSTSGAYLNCEFRLNEAESGGGLYAGEASYPSFMNCTFTANEAKSTTFVKGGALYFEPVPSIIGEAMLVTNCILWDNTPDEIGSETDGCTTEECADTIVSSELLT